MKAIVTGISGQDGFYMAEYLLNKGITVIGLTSDNNLVSKKISSIISNKNFKLHYFDYYTSGNFKNILKMYMPDLVFNFAAKSSGQGMFDTPHELTRINGVFVLDILEAMKEYKNIRFCQASSSEMFGNVIESPQNEQSPFSPKSPYGAAKLYAHNMIGIYRGAYGLHCSSAILYNHESVRRSIKFVTKKIAHTVAGISLGIYNELLLGNLDSKRDWGYAPEFVEAMYAMTQLEQPDDFILSTGRLHSVRDLCDFSFSHVGLNYRNYVISNVKHRPIESFNLVGNPIKASKILNWTAKKSIKDIMIEMIEYELHMLRS